MRIDVADAVGQILAGSAGIETIELDIRPVSQIDFDKFIDRATELQNDGTHVRAGEHRLKDWANGWAENFASFTEDGDASRLIPRYFGKYPEVRLNGKLFIDVTGRAELTLLKLLQTCALAHAKRIASFKSVCEFGAGTGHNLLTFGADKALRSLRGYEWSWSGVKCINEIGKRLDSRVSGHFFDYYAPGLQDMGDLSDCCVVTVASLEQIGADFRGFLDFLRRGQPKVIVNIEPIQELMGTGPLAELSKAYARKRNYLDGYYDYLRNLEQIGMIEIILEQDSLIGSKFINGYGALIWRWTK